MSDLNTFGPETSSNGEEVFSSPPTVTYMPAETSPVESTPAAQESDPVQSEPAERESDPVQATPAPQESAPVQTAPAPQESVPIQTTPVSQETSALTLWLTQPGAGGISCGGWAGLGLLAGLLAAGAAVAVAGWLRHRKKGKPAPDAPATWAGTVTVEKLHEQGARSGQQDSFFVSPPEEAAGLLAVVADGMGGLSDGDKVSQAAVAAMAQGFYLAQGTPQQVLLQLAEQANSAVNRLLGDDGAYRSGSTLTAGLIRGGAFHYLSIGDSRICLYRQGILYQLNREHIYRNDLYIRYVNDEETLEGASSHPKAAGLTSFLGMGQLKYIDLPAEPVTVLPGDRFILMSDGVYNALTQQELTAALSQGPGQAAQALNNAIRAKGYQNQDNYTAVILNC